MSGARDGGSAVRAACVLVALLVSGAIACDAVEPRASAARSSGGEETMATYIVAVKRERREDAPADWIERLRTTPGVELDEPEGDARAAGAGADARVDEPSGDAHAAGGPDGDERVDEPSGTARAADASDGALVRRRVRVRATASGIATLRERVGAFCHVEPLIEHRGPAGARDPSRSRTGGTDPRR